MKCSNLTSSYWMINPSWPVGKL